MKIDYKRLNQWYWFEDADGNEIVCNENEDITEVIKRKYKDSEVIYYRRCFPLELHDYIDEYCYHPKNLIIKFLCRKSRRFYKWISKGKPRTFKNILEGTTTFGSKWSQDCIVAMVNSGDFTLKQAIWVYANSCERCMNSLRYKYLNGADGYPEYSEEWQKCGTVCAFCTDCPTEKGDTE